MFCLPNAEQQQLTATIRDFLNRYDCSTDVPDAALWSRMSEQLRLPALVIPESYGGDGYGFPELVLVLEETGGALVNQPLLSVAVSAQALVHCTDEALKASWLPRIAAGRSVGALALGQACEHGRGCEVEVVSGDGEWSAYGTVPFVADGAAADFFVLAGRTAGVDGMYFLESADAGAAVHALAPLDPSRPLARLELDGARVRPLTGAQRDLVPRVLATAAVGLAAEQVGGAQRCLDMAVEYAKTRYQFGRPIGGFQAIKHKCADMVVAVESARSAVYHAADLLDDVTADPTAMAAVAQIQASAAYLLAAGANLQIHGGIGFTWDHPAHRYLRRARSSRTLFADPPTQLRRLADVVGI